MLSARFYLADQNPHRDRTRGISVYSDRLLEALREIPELRLSAVTSRSSLQPRPGRPEIEVTRLPFRTDGPCRRLLADHLHLAMSAELGSQSGADAPDLWHFPKGFLPALQRPKLPVVGTVHDTILEHYATHHPKHRGLAANSYWLGLLARSLARFDLVLTDSEFSRRSIETFCDARRIACPPIEVSYLAARWDDEGKRGDKHDNRVVHLISQLPHKRSDTALDFWQQLQSEQRDLPGLDLIGTTSASQRACIATLARVRCDDPLPDDALKLRIANARALLLPSEIEGFGLPALEAYGLGTPVLYVKGTAVEEVLGAGTPGGFDLDCLESFRAALDEVLALDEVWIAEKSRTLRSRFSWSACAQRTFQAYQGVA